MAGIYNQYLHKVEQYQPLLAAAEDYGGLCDFFVDAMWTELATAINEELGSVIFTAGRPNELHKVGAIFGFRDIGLVLTLGSRPALLYHREVHRAAGGPRSVGGSCDSAERIGTISKAGEAMATPSLLPAPVEGDCPAFRNGTVDAGRKGTWMGTGSKCSRVESSFDVLGQRRLPPRTGQSFLAIESAGLGAVFLLAEWAGVEIGSSREGRGAIVAIAVVGNSGLGQAQTECQ